MPEQRSRPKNGRVIALANQKGGTGKTTTTVNLGIGLARLGKKVLLIDADPQGDLTTCLGWQDQDSLQTTLATVMGKIIRDEPFTTDEGILHHSEGVDLMPANIELSELEVSLVNAMSREVTLRTYVNEAKKNYDVVLIDCMPSLGMITINALAAADSVIIPVQAHYLPAKGIWWIFPVQTTPIKQAGAIRPSTFWADGQPAQAPTFPSTPRTHTTGALSTVSSLESASIPATNIRGAARISGITTPQASIRRFHPTPSKSISGAL